MYSTSHGVPPWQSSGAYTTMQKAHATMQNAYIPVHARHSLTSQSSLPPPPTYNPVPFAHQNQPPPPPPPTIVATPAQARKKTAWSPDIRDYVNRTFALDSQIPGVAREELEARLKQVITDAAQSGKLETVDWKNIPLPQQMIHEEQKRAALDAHLPAQSFVSPVPFTQTYASAAKPELLRKRKSSELTEDQIAAAEPPWRQKKGANSLEDRVTFAPVPDKRQKLDMGLISKSDKALDKRRKRFEDARSGSFSPQTPRAATPPPSEPVGPVVGRSQKLEKHYFRLTSAPNPDDVRPLEVLRTTLDHLKKKWRSDNNYVYICDQFKSLRQDLTVQHIKNDFTTNVYEIHARIALEQGDLGEYNQCQTQLRALYKQNLGGHPVEFKAYRILYFIYTCNRTDMNDVLSDLTPADKSEFAIKHALDVRSALALGNYHKFFQLYLSVPNMGAYLMDKFVERERLAALSRICKSYKPDVKIRFVTEELGFESDQEACQFLLQHGPEELLEEKEGQVRLLTGKAGAAFEQAKQAAFKSVDIKGQI